MRAGSGWPGLLLPCLFSFLSNSDSSGYKTPVPIRSDPPPPWLWTCPAGECSEIPVTASPDPLACRWGQAVYCFHRPGPFLVFTWLFLSAPSRHSFTRVLWQRRQLPGPDGRGLALVPAQGVARSPSPLLPGAARAAAGDERLPSRSRGPHSHGVPREGGSCGSRHGSGLQYPSLFQRKPFLPASVKRGRFLLTLSQDCWLLLLAVGG